MKKFVKSVALTLATVLVFGMTVSAAGSTSTTNTKVSTNTLASQAQTVAQSGETKAVDANGATVKLTIGNETVETFDSAQSYATANGLGDVIATLNISSDAKNVTVTIPVPGLQAGVAVTVLHFNGSAWEQLAAKNNGDGTITFTTPSFSPFAVVLGGNGAAVVAPKTGEVIAMAAIVAIVMMAGAAVCARKARFQK